MLIQPEINPPMWANNPKTRQELRQLEAQVSRSNWSAIYDFGYTLSDISKTMPKQNCNSQ